MQHPSHGSPRYPSPCPWDNRVPRTYYSICKGFASFITSVSCKFAVTSETSSVTLTWPRRNIIILIIVIIIWVISEIFKKWTISDLQEILKFQHFYVLYKLVIFFCTITRTRSEINIKIISRYALRNIELDRIKRNTCTCIYILIFLFKWSRKVYSCTLLSHVFKYSNIFINIIICYYKYYSDYSYYSKILISS